MIVCYFNKLLNKGAPNHSNRKYYSLAYARIEIVCRTWFLSIMRWEIISTYRYASSNMHKAGQSNLFTFFVISSRSKFSLSKHESIISMKISKRFFLVFNAAFIAILEVCLCKTFCIFLIKPFVNFRLKFDFFSLWTSGHFGHFLADLWAFAQNALMALRP